MPITSHPFILEPKYTEVVAVAVRAQVKIGNSENAWNQKRIDLTSFFQNVRTMGGKKLSYKESSYPSDDAPDLYISHG